MLHEQDHQKKKKPQLEDGEASVWSTGLVFATLILLTALMFVLAKKLASEGLPPADPAGIEVRAKR